MRASASMKAGGGVTASKPWLLRTVLYVLIVVFVVFPAVMIFTMHTHLDTLSIGDSVGTIYRDIQHGFIRDGSGDETLTKTIAKVVEGEGEGYGETEGGDERDDLVHRKRAEQERLEQELIDSIRKEEHSSPSLPNDKDKDKDKNQSPLNPLKPWQLRQIEEDRAEYVLRAKEKDWIEILDTPKKPPIKHDKRVLIKEQEIQPLIRLSGEASNILGRPRALVVAEHALRRHLLYREGEGYGQGISALQSSSLDSKKNKVTTSLRGVSGKIQGQEEIEGDIFEDNGCVAGSICATMLAIKSQPACAHSPVYLTMASVGDELYWQLIENFVYSMVKFELVQCALVVCVSDDYCMRLCRDSLFPCFDYRRPVPSIEQQKKYHLTIKPSVMESIAELKLFHIPQALLHGVDTFMLDLDVGFLNDPRHMVTPFYQVPTIDIFVQQDYLFIMNRSQAGWKQWFTEPLPNIGMFLCRGNNKTHAVFAHAWRKYQLMTDPRTREQPGKDQNHVLDGMRVGRGTFGLRYAYFSNSTAALMDKIVQKWRGVELGGQPVADMFEREHTLAMHTTCYEQSTKVMGLKATNAFWNPRYYDPLRPTLTKQIIFINNNQVKDEVRSLVWLAMATGRALISPNLVGSDELLATSPQYNSKAMWPGFRVTFLKRVKKPSTALTVQGLTNNILGSLSARGTRDKLNIASGPGGVFQVKQNALNVQILEPAFYWRVQRDYDDVPEPTVLLFHENPVLTEVRDAILALPADKSIRVIIHIRISEKERMFRGMSKNLARESESTEISRVQQWAKSSVGELQLPFATEQQRYGSISSVKSIRQEGSTVEDVLQGMRTCNDVFARLRGNRTCFQICD